MPRVIDSFVFNDEFLVLEARLAELYDVVDYFILVEASHTQTRIKKPFYYLENKERFSKWNDKIVSVQLEEYVAGGAANWGMENWQRQQILVGLERIEEKIGGKLSFEDYLLVSDVDEIPMADKLKEVIDLKPDEPLSFNFYFNSYFANLYAPNRGWYGTIVCPLSLVAAGYSPQYLRSIKDKLPHVGEWSKVFFGWHLSAMGGFETVWKKAKDNIEPHDKSFCEDKFKVDFGRIFNKQVIEEGYFLFLDDPANKSIKLEKLDISLLPKYIQDNKDKYRDFILNE